MSFQDILSKEISTNQIKKPDLPQIIIENPLAGNIFCNGIECVLSAEFTRKGEMLVEIGGVSVFDSRAGGSFKNYSKFPIAVGKPMKVNDKIKIWAWNKIDSNLIDANFNIDIGKELNPINSLAVPKDEDLVNAIVSDTSTLFPFKVYTNEVITQLINMKGYQKMILTFQASNVIPASVIGTPVSNLGYTVGTGNDRDGTGQTIDTNTGLSINQTTFTGLSKATIYDLQYTRTQSIKIRLGASPVSQTILAVLNSFARQGSSDCNRIRVEIFANQANTWHVEEANDALFTDGVISLGYYTRAELILLSHSAQKRYIRFTELISVAFSIRSTSLGGSNNCIGSRCAQPLCWVLGGNGLSTGLRQIGTTPITEVYDETTTNGTAKIDFEIRNPDTNLFGVFIPSTEFGTVTQGDTVISQIGDVITKSVSGKTYALPSTQTDFRAKLTVTNGIKTGVSIVKVR